MKKNVTFLLFTFALIGKIFGVVVTTGADSGAGSLRQAIDDVNASISNIIIFNIPQLDPSFDPTTGTWKIVPLTALPPIEKQVTIDGTTQPTANIAAPIRIEISGEAYTFNQVFPNVGPDLPYGLFLAIGSDGSTVVGLAINRFVGLPEDFTTGRISGAGIHIESANNLIIHNFLGTNIDGKQSPNGATQVEQTRANSTAVECVGPFAFNNTIGGKSSQDRNIIAGSRFNLGSVRMSQGAHDNRVIGNYINVDVSGDDLVGQTVIGVGIDIGSFSNTIGGTHSCEGNVIAGCTYEQVGIYNFLAPGFYEPSLNNKIIGNLLGTNATGTRVLGTQEGDGISLTAGASGTLIQKNLISGNYRGIYAYQLELQVNNLVITDNVIGTDICGKNILGNISDGIHLQFSSDSVIEDNIVIGNLNGIVIDGQSRDNKVLGNIIDENRRNGIQIGTEALLFTENNVIGGCEKGEGNVITNNGKNGILLRYFSSKNTTIQCNSIGTDKKCTCNDCHGGNKENGIAILCSSDNLIKKNCIKNNGAAGVFIDDLCAKACKTDVRFEGVVFRDPITGQPVTMTEGVDVQERKLAAVGNTIDKNAIFDNCLSGIVLGKKHHKNDKKDCDCGPNRLQNHPVIKKVVTSKHKTCVFATLHSVPKTRFVIQLFANDKNRTKGHDTITEGKIFLDEFEVTTDCKGKVSFKHCVCDKHTFISATATRKCTGDTSEFSKNQEAVCDGT